MTVSSIRDSGDDNIVGCPRDEFQVLNEWSQQSTETEMVNCPEADRKLHPRTLTRSDEVLDVNHNTISTNSFSDCLSEGCTFSDSNDSPYLLQLHEISNTMAGSIVDCILRKSERMVSNLEINSTVRNGGCNRNRWGSEWGLCPWNSERHSTAETLPSNGKSRSWEGSQCKRRTETYHSPRRGKGWRPFKFHHMSDSKEYILSYRQNHTQNVILQEKEDLTTASRLTCVERVAAPSAVAQVTDLSSLVPGVELRIHDKHRLKKAVDRVQSIGEVKRSDSNAKVRNMSLGISKAKVGCSRALSVFRKSVDLSPVKKSLSSQATFDIVASIALEQRDHLLRLPPKALGTSNKYLNLRLPRNEVCFELRKCRQQPKQRETTLMMSVEKLILDNRNKDYGQVQIKAEELTNQVLEDGQGKCESREVDRKHKDKCKKGSHRSHAGSSTDHTSSEYLGFCLSQLVKSSGPASVVTSDEAGRKLTSCQVTGRQLRGDVITPRSTQPTTCNSDAPPVSKRRHAAPPTVSPRKEDVKLGIKGSNLHCRLQPAAETVNTLGIFDMSV